MTEEIEIGLIFASPRARPIDKANVARLADSIQQIGLINAISVRSVVRHRGTTPFDAYEIVAGHHRYAAALNLKWRTVRCEVVTMESLQAEMAEIDENLIRANLSPAQAASAIARRKAIYEELHPETKHGGNAAGPCGEFRHTDKEAFATATAKATGKSERTVREIAARGAALGDDLADIAGTSLDKPSELDALARMAPAERREIIELAKSGKRISARGAPPVGDVTDANPVDKQIARLMSAWGLAGDEARQEFLSRVEAPIMDRQFA